MNQMIILFLKSVSTLSFDLDGSENRIYRRTWFEIRGAKERKYLESSSFSAQFFLLTSCSMYWNKSRRATGEEIVKTASREEEDEARDVLAFATHRLQTHRFESVTRRGSETMREKNCE